MSKKEKINQEEIKQCDVSKEKIVAYLQKKEFELYNLMGMLDKDTEMYKETRAKHIVLLHAMEDLGIPKLESYSVVEE